MRTCNLFNNLGMWSYESKPIPAGTVEVINDASVKFNELVKEENEEKALAGAEGEVN